MLANKCSYTNLIICTIPINPGYYDTHDCITRINNKISTTTSKLRWFSINIDLLDLSDKFTFREFVNSHFYLNTRGLSRLSKFIKGSVRNFFDKPNVSNLKHIDHTQRTKLPVVNTQTGDKPELNLVGNSNSCNSNHFLTKKVHVEDLT